MCMWFWIEPEHILSVLQPFKLSHFLAAFLHCRVSSLGNRLLLQFSMNVSHTLQIYCGHIEDVHVGFWWS